MARLAQRRGHLGRRHERPARRAAGGPAAPPPRQLLPDFVDGQPKTIERQRQDDTEPAGHDVPVALLELGRKLHSKRSAFLSPRPGPPGCWIAPSSEKSAISSNDRPTLGPS